MKQNESNPALNPTDERVMKALRANQRWLRALTVAAVIFWSLAVIASVGVIVCYKIFYAPKEKQIFRDYESYGHIRDNPNAPAGDPPRDPQTASLEKALGIHFSMTWVLTKGILATSISVIVLSCGTLTTLLVVILNRRVTLRQINYSLEQISDQLKQLQTRARGK
jgi:hypothetical protein